MGIETRLSILFNVSLVFNLSCISKILRISNYGTASTDSAAYIFGGYWEEYDHDTFVGQYSIIAQFQNNEWQKIGDLKEVKSDTSAILHDKECLFIGGDSKSSSGRLVN